MRKIYRFLKRKTRRMIRSFFRILFRNIINYLFRFRLWGANFMNFFVKIVCIFVLLILDLIGWIICHFLCEFKYFFCAGNCGSCHNWKCKFFCKWCTYFRLKRWGRMWVLPFNLFFWPVRFVSCCFPFNYGNFISLIFRKFFFE